MNERIAKAMALKLKGKSVGGWRVEDYINHGKSAAVFRAEKDGQIAALKIFDSEVVERYGRDAQRKRIDRELLLRGKEHPNLVRIFDGGEDDEMLFIVMEYLPWKNLAESLQGIPPEAVRPLISQIAAAAKFLEDQSVAHRDIKPANIVISRDMKAAKLLDFGVIRPFDLSNITDVGEQRNFVGTLQYSPPELLFCEEEHSVEGWRAVSFYQLGAVLHDLLMRKPLFEKFKNPYALLARAVEREIPQVDAPDADSDLRLLAQNCLAKVANQRLDTVKWEDFSRPKVADPMESARKKIAQRRVAAQQATEAPSNVEDLLKLQVYTLRTAIHSAVVNSAKTESLPRYSIQNIRDGQPYILRVVFEPAESAGLRLFFAVYCEGNVVDPQASMHEVRVCAAASQSREALPAEPASTAALWTIRGRLIEQDIRPHVQQSLLLAFAAVLDIDATDATAVHWLDLGGTQ